MASFLVMRFEPTQQPPWLPVAVVEKTLEEGGTAAIEEVVSNPLRPEFAMVTRWKAVRFDDGPEMVPTVSLSQS